MTDSPWLRELARLLIEAAQHPAKKPMPTATMRESAKTARRRSDAPEHALEG